MTITLARYGGPKNSFPKQMIAGFNQTVEGTMRNPTDFLNPVFEVDGSYIIDPSAYNYVIADSNLLSRKYYINNIVVMPNNIYALECHVDVLNTYSEDILNSYAFINRNENTYNEMIIDDRIPLYPSDDPLIIYSSATNPLRKPVTPQIVIGVASDGK